MSFSLKFTIIEQPFTSLLTLIAAKISVLEGPLLADCCYSWHCKLRPLKGCFAVRSGSSNLRVGYSCFRPEADIRVVES